MTVATRLQLAMRTLRNKPRRTARSSAGIGFAVLLIWMQMGFLNAMFDAQVALLDAIDGDLFIVHRLKYALFIGHAFPQRRLQQAAGVPGVEGAFPIYLEQEASAWQNPESRTRRPIRVLGADPAHELFRDPEIRGHRAQLSLPDTVLIDVKSKKGLGGRLERGMVSELAGRSVVVVGTFSLGVDFAIEGTLITSDRNFLKFFPFHRAASPDVGSVALGIVRLTPDAAIDEVQGSLRGRLPDDVVVLQRGELREQELGFWRQNTPIGFVFTLGAAMGFVIGMMICYQILFTEVIDRLPQFGTLKAMGFSTWHVVSIVLLEAVLLGLGGFVLALAVGRVFYALIAAATGLPMAFTTARVVLLLLVTLIMCVSSAALAVRRAAKADPAELFA